MTGKWPPAEVGQKAVRTRVFTGADVETFGGLSGDRNPMHFDEAFAAATPLGGTVVHGALTTSVFSALIADELPGPGSVLLSQRWDYVGPVRVGDAMIAELEVLEARLDKPITRLRCRGRVGDRDVLRGEAVAYRMGSPALAITPR